MDEIRVLEKIKALPQTEETLTDAFELVRQIEDKQLAVEWNGPSLYGANCVGSRVGHPAAAGRNKSTERGEMIL